MKIGQFIEKDGKTYFNPKWVFVMATSRGNKQYEKELTEQWQKEEYKKLWEEHREVSLNMKIETAKKEHYQKLQDPEFRKKCADDYIKQYYPGK